MKISELKQKYSSFLQGETAVYFSPGRVNLIGEHIDYLGGNVFPTAISLGTYGVISKREDKEFHLISENFSSYGVKTFDVNDLSYKEEDNWANFVKGMVLAFLEKGYDIPHGFNIVVYGTLPNSSGLSSSASLEVLIGTILNTEFEWGVPMFDLVQIAQKVENEYMGVNCGIMDQFAVGMSKRNQAIYLNTNTLEYSYVPLDFGEYQLIIANTNKKRTLADSKYNERRQECDLGLQQIQHQNPEITELCDMDIDQLEQVKEAIPSDIILKRVTHAVYENIRVQKAVEALKQNDIKQFAYEMNDSHNSLRDLYEVSCIELDTLVSSFRTNGAIGARMTGAGFGGCMIALVHKDIVEEVIQHVKQDYLNKIGYDTSVYPVHTSDGAKRLERNEG